MEAQATTVQRRTNKVASDRTKDKSWKMPRGQGRAQQNFRRDTYEKWTKRLREKAKALDIAVITAWTRASSLVHKEDVFYRGRSDPSTAERTHFRNDAQAGGNSHHQGDAHPSRTNFSDDEDSS